MANGFITSLLTDFASRCQLEPLVFDEDDCCHLLVEQNTAITIRAQEDRVTLIGLISGNKPSADILHQHMKGALTQGLSSGMLGGRDRIYRFHTPASATANCIFFR